MRKREKEGVGVGGWAGGVRGRWRRVGARSGGSEGTDNWTGGGREAATTPQMKQVG